MIFFSFLSFCYCLPTLAVEAVTQSHISYHFEIYFEQVFYLERRRDWAVEGCYEVITRYDMDKGYWETGRTLSGLQTLEQLSLVGIYWKKEVFQREDNGNGNLLSPDVVKS